MEIIPIITTILIYAAGVFVVIVLVSSIAKRIFVVKPKIEKKTSNKEVPSKLTIKNKEPERSKEEIERLEYESQQRRKERQRRLAEEEKANRYSESKSKRRSEPEVKQKTRSSRFIIVNDKMNNEEMKPYNKSAFYPIKTEEEGEYKIKKENRRTN